MPRNRANWPAIRAILLTWLDHLEQSFSYRDFQFKNFCPPAKTSCPSTENINETTDCKMHELKVLVSKETVELKQPPSKTDYSEKRPERNFTMLSWSDLKTVLINEETFKMTYRVTKSMMR